MNLSEDVNVKHFMQEQEATGLPTRSREWFHSPAWSYGMLLAVLVLFGLIRIRLLNIPLERDEGEYAYAGSLILRGIAPYQLCYTMKLPGTAAAYALIEATFGRSSAAIHLGLLLVNSITIVLVYLLAKRFFGYLGGAVAAAAFGLLSLEQVVLGFSAHATQFVVMAATGGILILLHAIERPRTAMFLCSGLLLGLAMLMKQPGAFFILFGILYAVQSGWKQNLLWRNLAGETASLLVGAIVPFALTCLIMGRMGVFSRFWFWTFSYTREYESVITLAESARSFLSVGLYVVSAAALIWLVAAFSPVLLLRDAKSRPHAAFLASFLFFSCAALALGFHFRDHYFVLVLPAVSLLCAATVSPATNLLLDSQVSRNWTFLPAGIFLLCIVFSVVQQRDVFFVEDPAKLSRATFGDNPFPEALVISDFIRNHSRYGDRVAVIGSEPEIYFYSDRLSATGYIYMYPLTEAQPFASTMQKEMIAEIEAAQPRFLVLVNCRYSWLVQPNSDNTIFEWIDQYVRGYHLVGIADMLAAGTEYHWDDAATYLPRSRDSLFVYDREQKNQP